MGGPTPQIRPSPHTGGRATFSAAARLNGIPPNKVILHPALPTRVEYQHEPRSEHRVRWVFVFTAVNVLVFLLYLPPYGHLIDDFGLADLTYYLMDLINDGGYPEWALYHPSNPDWFQMISHQFAHAGAAHLWANLVALLYCGRFAEREYGGFVVIAYLLGGVAGALAHGFWDIHPLLGSSGAVSAVLGSCLALGVGWRTGAKVIVVWLVIYNVVPLFFAFDNISYAAHIGGFVAGIVLGAIYATVRWVRDRRRGV